MNDIFIKKNSLIKSINLDELKENIPKEAINKPDIIQQKTKVEWRWRFLNIYNKNIVEISYIEPNSERIYLDKYGQWKAMNINEYYDKFVISKYYYYAELE
jgi:hypothetical protein